MENDSKSLPSQQTELKFATDYSLLPEVSSDPIFHKAVQAVHSYPVKGEMDITTRRVMNALIVYAQTMFRHMTDERRRQIKDKEIRGTPIFKIRVAKLREMIEQSSHDNTRIYKALDNLFNWFFVYNVMADEAGESVIIGKGKARFISDLCVGEKDGLINGEITYEIPNNVLLMVLEPKPHAQIEIAAVNSLRGANAAALYENCARYLGTKYKVTAILPVQEWVNLIAGEGKYPGAYKDFHRYVLKPAMELLKSNPAVPFTVEVIEKFGPRKKVLALQFKLVMKNQTALPFDELPLTWPADLLDMLRKVYMMSNADIVELGQMATEDEVKEAIRRDSVMVQKKLAAGNPVKDRSSYLKGILRNMQQGKAIYAEPEPDAEELESRELSKARDTAKRLRLEFENFQLSTIKARLADLAQGELESLRAAFEEAKRSDVTVTSMIAKGWGVALNSMLVNWIRANPEWAPRFLLKANEVDFEIWREMSVGRD